MKWSYGITTVPGRSTDLLPRTLASLSAAGFPSPHLFVDGEGGEYRGAVTRRVPPVRTAGNWLLSAAELYLRDPWADMYAVFQDDMVSVRGLRSYLERTCIGEKAYWNMYTFPCNVKGRRGWHPSNQLGRGAVALAFTRKGIVDLITHQHMVERAQSATRGFKAVDGGIVTAMNKAGYSEYCHTPSLTQHTGLLSSMGNTSHPLAGTFPGEEYDASRGFSD